MFRLTKSATFEASHKLPKHGGKCARLHGHSWGVTIEVEGEGLVQAGPSTGMLQDFYDLGGPLKELVEAYLDHWHLNDSTGLENPTSEELARWIYKKLKPFLRRLSAVTVRETCTSSCEYRPAKEAQ